MGGGAAGQLLRRYVGRTRHGLPVHRRGVRHREPGASAGASLHFRTGRVHHPSISPGRADGRF
eukprot:11188297-Lingulodinium_polyedra.AAC.1